jgi:outer membrane protein OmpA-like peptidoglycan-associated protein
LVGSIESAVDILMDNNDFKKHPLPNRDPYRLMNSQFIQELYQLHGQGSAWNQNASNGQNTAASFSPLSAMQWDKLESIGSLKARNITFASGTAELTDSGLSEVDSLIKDLKHYPAFRIEIRGHTATRGDAEVNLSLSQERAKAVLKAMNDRHGVDPNRVRAIGFGGSNPLPKLENESNRAWRYRLPRVELVLVRETI